MSSSREEFSATLLRDGQVLITGGLSSDFMALSSAELYNPATGTWSLTTPMNDIGYAQTSTWLPGGNVLVTGFGGTGSKTAEVYDPATAAWTDTGPMTTAHEFATATLLPDGDVLLAGGATAVAELYHPATNDWTATGSLNVGRQAATATLLPDGKVLVAGGEPPGGGNALASSELYDPATGTWSLTANMTTGRYGATATLLTNGLVLVTGGCSGGCGDEPALSSTEVYNDGFWYADTSMTQPRVFQTATLLPDGTVLVAGGGESYYGAGTATAELYTPTLLSVNPASGPAGTQLTVTGSGFYAHETATLYWNGESPGIGHAKTSLSGTFTTKITIPPSPPGANTLAVRGNTSFAGATATFTVTTSP
jgi:(2Fe-2S) ferredoxin